MEDKMNNVNLRQMFVDTFRESSITYPREKNQYMTQQVYLEFLDRRTIQVMHEKTGLPEEQITEEVKELLSEWYKGE
jgi:hypothetical protein